MKSQEVIESAISFDCNATAPCANEIKFTVAAAGVDAAFNEAAKAASKYAKMPGFRPGKAPLAMVKARCADYILEEVERSLQQTGFAAFSKKDEGKTDIVAFGKMDAPEKPAAGKDYCFTITVE